MIDLAVSQLQSRLSELAWLDLVAGVVREQKLNVDGKVKTLPAMPDPDNAGEYILLVPADEHSGIAYFDVLSNQKRGDVSGGRAYLMESVVRLVVWLNTKRLSPSSVIPQAMAAIVSKLSGNYSDVSPVGSLAVTPLQEVPKTPAIFSKWTYDEAESQYLMLPYEYFAFDFQMMFTLSASCPVVNIVRTDLQC